VVRRAFVNFRIRSENVWIRKISQSRALLKIMLKNRKILLRCFFGSWLR
jgi:hypothetical protein